jgi:hypothetical protein
MARCVDKSVDSFAELMASVRTAEYGEQQPADCQHDEDRRQQWPEQYPDHSSHHRDSDEGQQTLG